MKKRYKVGLWFAGIIAIGVIVLRLVLSHDSPCETPPPASASPAMKGWIHPCYGGPETLVYQDVPKPVPADDEVLVRVRAASVNPLDWHVMRGKPYAMRLMGSGLGKPRTSLIGVDYAGVVEAVGNGVTGFRVGDEVFGARDGAFSEFVVAKADRSIQLKPANLSFQEAAAVPVAAITALQALRDLGQLKSGEKVLINGASGGVGTYAVQIAKALGAHVTGVCSGRNVELVKSLGADRVIDYTTGNPTAEDVQYDLIVDNVVTHDLSDYRKVLTGPGRFVMVGSLDDGEYLGPINDVAKLSVYDPFVSQDFSFLMASLNPEDLATLRDMLAEGKIRSVIDRTYRLAELREAIAYVETGRARGKVVVVAE
jgi:NADPH:quinone reductase-like Zn-dependent oxidoreductase